MKNILPRNLFIYIEKMEDNEGISCDNINALEVRSHSLPQQ